MTGRLLPVETGDGAYQMRRDEALLAECAEAVADRGLPGPPDESGGRVGNLPSGQGVLPRRGRLSDQTPVSTGGGSFPALRFYHWEPPCISLGRNQDLGNPRHGRIDLDAASRRGVEIVRRPSGGRAILHYHDLTYALVMPADSDDISSSHRVISAGLAAGLRSMGVNVDDGLVAMPPHRNPADCFASVAGADLQAAGRKVMGSAQRRSGGALLEHGTLYLTTPDPLYGEVFGQPFGGSVVALDELLGHSVSFEEVAEALTRGLESALGVQFA